MAKNNNDENGFEGKLDTVIRLLEDLFILQAVSLGITRENIRRTLGVHTTRISKITKGVKQARKHSSEET